MQHSPALDAAEPAVQSQQALALRRLGHLLGLLLLLTVVVILGGALVRATHSGDGCGDSWPSCHGDLVPSADKSAQKTWVEWTHRASSGLMWLLSAGLALWSWRRLKAEDRVRRATLLSFFFMTTEALIGALLVVLRLVAYNDSALRVLWVAMHLLNTFLLLAAMTWAWWWAYRPELKTQPLPPQLRWLLRLSLLGMLVVGCTGAIAALADTLFPAVKQVSPWSPLLLRLRMWHPLVASGWGLILVLSAVRLAEYTRNLWLGVVIVVVLLLQMMVGWINISLLTPITAQLIHLALADGLWILLVASTAYAMGKRV